MLALVSFSMLGQTCDELVVAATAMLNSTGFGGFAFCRYANSHFRKAEGLQRGRKLQRQTFRYKHGFRKSVLVFALMSIGFDSDGRSSDELTG
jgi:hypothetical protein